jgi:hypothetical protein
MSFRCINAFSFGDTVYANGYEAADGDPILKTHADHFAEVDNSPFVGRAVEQAVAEPGGLRAVSKKKAPAKAAPKPAAHKTADDSPAESDEEKK